MFLGLIKEKLAVCTFILPGLGYDVPLAPDEPRCYPVTIVVRTTSNYVTRWRTEALCDVLSVAWKTA